MLNELDVHVRWKVVERCCPGIYNVLELHISLPVGISMEVSGTRSPEER